MERASSIAGRETLIPTIYEAPSDEAIAHPACRAGYIRKLGSGIYDYLPLGAPDDPEDQAASGAMRWMRSAGAS